MQRELKVTAQEWGDGERVRRKGEERREEGGEHEGMGWLR